MSFPPATEMFQFAGFASTAYGFSGRYPLPGGLPHSEIPGSKGARASPGLFAACHVLHRLSTPRHSPDALRSLAPLQQRAPSCTKAHACRHERPLAKRRRPCLADAEHPLRRLNRNGQKQAYHAWRSSMPAFRNGGEPPLRPSGPDELMRPTRPERRSPHGTRPCRSRRSIALPAFDQTCLFTMYKEHSPEHPTDTASAAADRNDRENHVTSLSPADASKATDRWRAHAIGWWAWADLNSRPHAYQACALTN